jgi:hypothetical protein
MKVYRYGDTEVVVFESDRLVRTTLPDGAVVWSAPVDDAESKARAERLGYGEDLWAMCRDHDAVHAAVAHMLGRRDSYALRRAAQGLPIDDLAGAEEDAVMALQRLWNLYRAERGDVALNG